MVKHKAIVKGLVFRKKYWFWLSLYGDAGSIREDREFVREETLWEGEIDTPLLEQGECLHIKDLDVAVHIERRDRSTCGAYIYKTDHIIELLEDEKTLQSKEEAEIKEGRYLAQKIAEAEEEDKEKEELAEKKSWWKRLFK